MKHLNGLILEEGSVGSHTTIVCRALNIPLVLQAKSLIEKANHGDKVILDGDKGVVHLRPEKEIIGSYKSKKIALKNAQPKIMKVAQKGILHKNTAARKVSRLAKKVKNIS